MATTLPRPSNSLRRAVIAGTALFATYTPSSVAGVMSPPLNVVAIGGTFALLSTLLVLPGGVGHPVQVVFALGIVVALIAFTVLSPFTEISPGLIPIFGSLAVLYALNLRDITLAGTARWALLAVLGISLVFGTGLALDVAAVDRIAVSLYSAFYPELLGNMVLLNNKPVLTLGTHSLAAFVIYLFVYLCYTAWRVFPTWPRRIGTLWFIVLLWRLTSTTSLILTGVAILQVAALQLRRRRWLLPVGTVLAVGVGLSAFLMSSLTLLDMLELARDALLGDRIRGLLSRYAPGGLLAGNFEYLSQHPLRPIGVGFTPTLYLGDSGVLLMIMRGSIPLLLAVYGGLFAFLRYNLRSRAQAHWIFVVIVAFEIGFTPLQYFRFVGLLPLLIVAFNHLSTAETPTGAQATGRPAAERYTDESTVRDQPS